VTTTPAVPAETIYNLLVADWDRANLPLPNIVQRETAEELREEIPDEGLVLVYAESGGVRSSPRGNMMYKDETVNVIIDVWTLKSHEHLYQLQGEILRTIEENTMDVSPYQLVRPLSFAEEYGKTFQAWHGDVRVELSRYAIRTGYTI